MACSCPLLACLSAARLNVILAALRTFAQVLWPGASARPCSERHRRYICATLSGTIPGGRRQLCLAPAALRHCWSSPGLLLLCSLLVEPKPQDLTLQPFLLLSLWAENTEPGQSKSPGVPSIFPPSGPHLQGAEQGSEAAGGTELSFPLQRESPVCFLARFPMQFRFVAFILLSKIRASLQPSAWEQR